MSTPDPPARGHDAESPPGPAPRRARGGGDPLRGSRTSGTWFAVVALLVVLLLLAVFILQNTQAVEIAFFGWNGEAPLAAALLIATVAGLVIATSAGALRILQLRRRVKRERT